MDIIRLGTEQSPDMPSEDEIVTRDFSKRRLTCLTGAYGLLPAEVTFTDTSLDRYAAPKQLEITDATSQGLTIDVTGMPECIYPFNITTESSLDAVARMKFAEQIESGDINSDLAQQALMK